MKELYHVEGAVDRGFQGQITYMVCLEKPCTKLDVHLTYDFAELRYRDDKIPKSEIVRVFGSEEKYRRCPEITPEEARKYLIYDIDLKTEIHPLATLNDEFIGCIHKQKPDRHMIFTRSTASHGCIPREVYEGVLKITLLVFNVAKDNTRYTLTVSGH